MRKLEDLNKSYFGPRVSDGAGVYVAGFVFMYILQVVLMLVTGFIVELDLNNPPLWYQWVATIVNQGAFVLAVFLYFINLAWYVLVKNIQSNICWSDANFFQSIVAFIKSELWL